MPSFIELQTNQSNLFPSASEVGNIILAVSSSNNIILKDENGNIISVGGGSTVSASNGLTIDENVIQLGGVMNQNIDLDPGNFNGFTINDNSNPSMPYFQIGNNSAQMGMLDNAGLQISSIFAGSNSIAFAQKNANFLFEYTRLDGGSGTALQFSSSYFYVGALANTSSNSFIQANSEGVISNTPIPYNLNFTTDSDIISAIVGATYNGGNVFSTTITPINSKIFFQGQIYSNPPYLYIAISDNRAFRISGA